MTYDQLEASQSLAMQKTLIQHHFDDNFWIEDKALEQLSQIAALPDSLAVDAFPDLHPGKFGPVGMAFLAHRLYPLLIGNDIGCGMAIYQLDLKVRSIRLDKTADRLREMDQRPIIDLETHMADAGIDPALDSFSLGTIGGGNHFCELQMVQDNYISGAIDPAYAYLLVHSGSRGIGQQILDRTKADMTGFEPSSDDANTYMKVHDQALLWARLNRQLIALKAARALKVDFKCLCDIPHNMIEKINGHYLHRKGAAIATGTMLPIAGSRDSLSFIVKPGEKIASAQFSLSHGSGRKYDRSSMIGRIGKPRSKRESMQRNQWGGHIICDDRQLIIEESPQAYKDSMAVIRQLELRKLAEPIAAMRPIITYKKAIMDRSIHLDRKGKKDV